MFFENKAAKELNIFRFPVKKVTLRENDDRKDVSQTEINLRKFPAGATKSGF